MGTCPQTLYGMADSPIDLAAFAIDHGDGTGQPGLIAHVIEGRLPGELTRDDILDNIMLYWLTNTGVSAARLYWEKRAAFFAAKDITIPLPSTCSPTSCIKLPGAFPAKEVRNEPDNNEFVADRRAGARRLRGQLELGRRH
jgi:hypothetical protein